MLIFLVASACSSGSNSSGTIEVKFYDGRLHFQSQGMAFDKLEDLVSRLDKDKKYEMIIYSKIRPDKEQEIMGKLKRFGIEIEDVKSVEAVPVNDDGETSDPFKE